MFTTNPLARGSFRLKVMVSVLLIGLADWLFLFHEPGIVVGLFALAWLVGTVAARPGLLRDPRAGWALLLAAGLALVMVDRPGLLAWVLFGLAMAVAALSARVGAGEPCWRWVQRLAVLAAVALFGPLIDLRRILRLRPGRRKVGVLRLVGLLVLPLAGGTVFLALFASANPLISDVLDRVRLPGLSMESVVHVWFWGVVLVVVGGTLRPRWRNRLIPLPTLRERAIPGLTAASIILSLIVFNALFALQNGLDLAFLWSGAPLPHDMTLADYAHRGAYPLIATALLAGLFVLVFLRPGSATADRPLVRGLVVLWVAQNMLLVASSLLRTADYIEVYSLTRFRIAAMIWMVLVAVGLLLICARMLFNRSPHWLIDANVRATLAVLVAVSVVDLGAVSAAWNVRHAREVDGTGARLDLCYLNRLGPEALVSVSELARTTTDPALRDRAIWVATVGRERLAEQQADWRSWTWRGQRRLARIDALPAPFPGGRDCDGGILAPPPPPPSAFTAPPPALSADAPLTSAPGA